jgi:hypothetical protein
LKRVSFSIADRIRQDKRRYGEQNTDTFLHAEPPELRPHYLLVYVPMALARAEQSNFSGRNVTQQQ